MPRPLDALEEALHEEVTVALKGGDRFAGRLSGYDQHMNLVLEAVETDDGVSLGDVVEGVEYVEDTTIIRGDNVVSIRP